MRSGFGARVQADKQVRDAFAGGMSATEAFNRFGVLQASIERVRGQVSESLFAALGWEMGRIWQSDEKVKDIRVARRHARAVAATAGAGARSNQDWGIGLDA